MIRIFSSFFAAILLALGLDAVPAQAQQGGPPLSVFVAAQGLDSNPCTFAQPCRTFQHAHDTVAFGGLINVLDPGNYSPLKISKSVSIQGHGVVGISVSTGETAISVNSSDPIITITVTLDGLVIDGVGLAKTGIELIGAGRANLFINNCVVRNFLQSGIALKPGGGMSNVAVSNTVVTANRDHGIFLQPTVAADAGAIFGSFNRVEANGNGITGIAIFGNLLLDPLDAQLLRELAENRDWEAQSLPNIPAST